MAGSSCLHFRCAVLALLSGAAAAAAGISDNEWSTMINKAGRQRMLSQKMSKEFLLVALGLNPDADRAAMRATVAEFGDMLSKFIQGSPAELITTPPDTLIAAQLNTVQILWDEFRTLLTLNVDAPLISRSVLFDVAAKSLPLLSEMNAAVNMYVAAATAAGAGAPGAVVNVAGRQRMLTQKMSKEAFLVALDVDVAGTKRSLRETKKLFVSSFEGLVLSSAQLGIPKTTDACILQQMGVVNSLWVGFEPLLDRVLTLSDDDRVPAETLARIREKNPVLLVEMNNAVSRYVESTSGPASCSLPVPTAPQYTEVINKAGRQRMLSQKVSKELFLMALGQPQHNKMQVTMGEFATVLLQLLLGSAAAGLPSPPNQQIATQLGLVVDHWLPLQYTLHAVVTSGADYLRTITSVATGNMALLTEMNRAVESYAAAATAAGVGTPSTVVNKAGRQRMLTQKMSKEAMLVQLGHLASVNRATLKDTMQEFDEVLTGLVDGSTKHALPPTVDGCILQKLEEVRYLWWPFKRLLGNFEAGSATTSDVARVANTNELLLVKMNEAVSLYVQAAATIGNLTCDSDRGSLDAAWRGCRPAAMVLLAAFALSRAAFVEP